MPNQLFQQIAVAPAEEGVVRMQSEKGGVSHETSAR